ncbi:hypothetical protein OIE43_41420 [Streptomyces pseudovenezuelae]|uniref:hypothetical protein n=1 Tax=Streptomyces pseudovenezuelae TaxID=67350 RepID=UPI002E361212|nr:hypothetical protein [Streptomyces pseudovenezuelae]
MDEHFGAPRRVEIEEELVLEGVLIAESLRVGAELVDVPLQVTKIVRLEVESAAAEQPQQWTLLDFAAEEGDAEPLAEQLSACLAPTGGWYVNYNTMAEAFVVFAGKVFRYPRGQVEGRRRAQDYARSIGIPEPQLDWQD